MNCLLFSFPSIRMPTTSIYREYFKHDHYCYLHNAFSDKLYSIKYVDPRDKKISQSMTKNNLINTVSMNEIIGNISFHCRVKYSSSSRNKNNQCRQTLRHFSIGNKHLFLSSSSAILTQSKLSSSSSSSSSSSISFASPYPSSPSVTETSTSSLRSNLPPPAPLPFFSPAPVRAANVISNAVQSNQYNGNETTEPVNVTDTSSSQSSSSAASHSTSINNNYKPSHLDKDKAKVDFTGKNVSSAASEADEAIEGMSIEQLLQQLFDGSWSGHDTIYSLTSFNHHHLRFVRDLRSLSDSIWLSLRLPAPLERSIRLYLLSTAQVESYATRMNLPSSREYSRDLLREPLYREQDLGKPLPHSPHACSVSLPLWRHVIGYEEGTTEVISAMACGYPRFFIHPYVSRLFEVCERQFASSSNETCFAFPSFDSAQRCVTFLQAKIGFGVTAKIVALGQTGVHAVVFKKNLRLPVRLYWQHFGDIISSRFAWDLLHGTLAKQNSHIKQVLRSRIALEFGENSDDIYLYPSGMSAISKSLQMVQVLNPGVRSVQFGFPYLDAYKVQTVFGPGALFYPNGDEADIDQLEKRLNHEKFSAVLVEFPGNPLLSLPNLPRLSSILRKHSIPLIVDDTVSSFGCVNVLPYADLVTSSLTKWFSGNGDVMAGSITLNSRSPFYSDFKQWQNMRYEDLLYHEDAVVLEQNSRDFKQRLAKINATTQTIIQFLSKHPFIKQLYSPLLQTNNWDNNHQVMKLSTSQSSASLPISYHPSLKVESVIGFGGLFSFVLVCPETTTSALFDVFRVSKGPSLGNNFSLCCPYTILAHYGELDWAESVGISRYLLRMSVGLEDASDLIQRFTQAFAHIQPLIQKQQQIVESNPTTDQSPHQHIHQQEH